MFSYYFDKYFLPFLILQIPMDFANSRIRLSLFCKIVPIFLTMNLQNHTNLQNRFAILQNGILILQNRNPILQNQNTYFAKSSDFAESV